MHMTAVLTAAGAVFAAISSTCTAFLSPGAPRVRITNVVRRPSKLSHQHQYHHERAPRAPRWTKSRIFKPAFERRSAGETAAAAEDSMADDGGAAEAVRREVGRIREARLRAGQIKAELDALGVSYAGLLEKSEFEQALAEARVVSSGQVPDQAPAAEDAEDDEATTSSDPQQQSDQDLKQGPRSEELGEQGESSAGGSDSEDAEPSSPEPSKGSDTKEETMPEAEPVTESFNQPESVEEPEGEPEPKQGSVADSFTQPQSVEEPEAEPEPKQEPIAESFTQPESIEEPQAEPEPKQEPVAESFTQPESVEEPEAEPERKQEPVAESFTQPESVEERNRQRESPPEQPSPGPAPEVKSVAEPAPALEPVSGEPVPETVSVDESPVPREAFTSTPEVGNEEGQSSDSVDPRSGVVNSDGGGDIEEEISRIREARTTAGQIKAELDSMGISYVGLLEKAEFVKKLAEARTNPAATGARDGGVDNKGAGSSGESAVGDVNVSPGEEAADTAAEGQRAGGPFNTGVASVDPQTSAEGMRSSNAAAADDDVDDEEYATLPPPPPPSRPMGEETSDKPTRMDGDEESEGRSDEMKARSAVDREEVLAMRISQIKQELDERGVTYRGLLEKSEFVDLLIDARERGITASPTASAGVGGGNAEATRSGEDGAEKRTDGFDPSYKDVEMKKMKQDTDGPRGVGGGGPAGPGGMPGSMPAGAGFDIGSILGAMGGMGGGGGAGAPGVPGGVDIGSILGAMGGMGGPPPSGGGSSSGGAASGMGDMLGKLMNNPKAQAVFQKAQSNPKVMAAIQDVSQNGLGAMAKYSNDPEIRDVIEDLKSIF